MKAFPTNVSFYINNETKGSHAAALVKVILKVSLGRGEGMKPHRDGIILALTACTLKL